MIELVIVFAAWISVGAAVALAVGRASAIGAPRVVPCPLARMPRR